MTDTSRPTVEALIRESRTTQGYSEGDLRSVIKSMAAVLGALLTERDELEAERDAYSDEADDWTHKWAAALDERDAARAQIAEAQKWVQGFLAEPREDSPTVTYAAWARKAVLHLHHAILRGVQGDAKLSTNSRGVQEATEPGFRFRFPSAGSFMRVCPTCGNKRCPHVDTRFRCTGSNEYGQVGVLEATEPSEPSAYARFAKIASQFPADIAKEIGLWMRSAGYDPTEEGEHERWAKDYNMPHEFRPVAGHPDDDECTDRRDGTDATYCGLPRRLHGYPRPEPSEPWQDPEPSIRFGWRHSYRTDCDRDPDCYPKPRSRAVYDAETKGEKP